MVRWTMGGAGGVDEAVVRSERRGDRLRVTLDFVRDAALPGALPTLMLLPGDGRGSPVELPMRWEDEDRVVAEYTLPGSGTWHPVVKLGTRALRAPPVTLPYAPEFEPGSAQRGLEVLRGLASVSGGQERLSLTDLFAHSPESEGRVALAPWLVGLALVALLAEVAARRFLSAPRLRPARTAPSAAAMAGPPVVPERSRTDAPPRALPPSASSEPERPREESGVDSALEAARERARRRLRE
jgi:hypothetical protein